MTLDRSTPGAAAAVSDAGKRMAGYAEGTRKLCAAQPYAGFHRARYFVHGGSGMVMSAGLFSALPTLPDVQAVRASIEQVGELLGQHTASVAACLPACLSECCGDFQAWPA